jgi:DNA end-binding protein Ku
MAPRANWKGFLRLSLVTCPVALYPATSESEKVSFNQLNRKTGHRIKYAKVDSDTGEEVANEDIVKGYKLDTDTFIEVTKEELENVALESTRTIEIDEFVDRSEIDPRYLIRAKERPRGENVVDLMDALRKSLGAAEPAKGSKPAKKPRKIASGQKEMLMPITGKKPAKEAVAKKPGAKPQRKSA